MLRFRPARFKATPNQGLSFIRVRVFHDLNQISGRLRENPNLGRDLGWGLVGVKGKYMKDANSDYRLRSGKVNTQRPLSRQMFRLAKAGGNTDAGLS